MFKCGIRSEVQTAVSIYVKEKHLFLLIYFFTDPHKTNRTEWNYLKKTHKGLAWSCKQHRESSAQILTTNLYCAAVLTVVFHLSLTFVRACSVKVPWNSCSWAQGLCLADLLWCFSAGPSWADIHQILVGPWYRDLSQKEKTQTTPYGPLIIKFWTEREKHLYPTAFTAEQIQVTNVN